MDFQAAGLPRRLRLQLDWVSPGWKSQVKLGNEPFTSASTGWIGFRSIKFLILADEPWRVYFQNTGLAQFHYDFAKSSLPEFAAISLEEFNQVTLHPGPGQRAILGALLFPPPEVSTNKYGIQFVGNNPYPPERLGN